MSQRSNRAIKRPRLPYSWLRSTISICAILILSVACWSYHESIQVHVSASTPVRLSHGDVIKVSFSDAPELSQSQKIKADCKVNLPIIGEVNASGKTVPEFQSEFMRLYNPLLRYTELVVTLESGVVNVVVSGYVTKPGKLVFGQAQG